MQIINQKVEVLLPIFSSLPFKHDLNEIIKQVINELVSTTFLFPIEADQLTTNQVKVSFNLLDESDIRINLCKKSVRKRFFS